MLVSKVLTNIKLWEGHRGICLRMLERKDDHKTKMSKMKKSNHKIEKKAFLAIDVLRGKCLVWPFVGEHFLSELILFYVLLSSVLHNFHIYL